MTGFDWKASHVEQTARLVKALAALRAMLQDYRSEGCPDPNCGVCKRSKVAESLAREALACEESGATKLERLFPFAE
jgi:hypothetical protein